MTAVGLYIHFPFCRAKCPYCHFASAPEGEGLRERWFKGLEREVAIRSREGYRADTVYVGGGTPSLLTPPELGRLAGVLASGIELAPKEFTLEANPEPGDPRRLDGWRESGVDRLSVGVQSFDDRLLGLLGRRYTALQAADFVRAARRAGYRAVGMDLMIGVPTETPDSLALALDAVGDLAPDHVSLYLLENLEGLPFEAFAREHAVGDDAAADAYELMREGLEARGLRRYEISNFAREGSECLHNMKYWRYEPFLGLGPSACSHAGPSRWCNLPTVAEWSGRLDRGEDPRDEVRRLAPDEALREALVSGLRLSDGIGIAALGSRFGADILERFRGPIAELVHDGFLVLEGDRLRIAAGKFLVSNAVLSRFV